MKHLVPVPLVHGTGPNPIARMGAPISFAANVTDLAAGASAVLNAAALQSGYRTPYLLDEIRFIAYYTNVYVTTTNSGFVNLGWPISVKLKLGQHDISKASIPMALYGPNFGIPTVDSSALYDQSAGVSGNQRVFVTVRFLLPKPLYMLPGDVVQCSLLRDLNIGAAVGNATFHAVYVGRSLPPGAPPPAKRDIPWLGYFEAQIKTTGSIYFQTSDELRNPFNAPLKVQRFVGRFFTAGTADSSETTGTFVFEGGFPNIVNGSPSGLIRVTDSMGYFLTGGGASASGGTAGNLSYIHPRDVFDARAAWTHGRELGAREQINWQLMGNQLEAGTAIDIYSFAMIGHREES